MRTLIMLLGLSFFASSAAPHDFVLSHPRYKTRIKRRWGIETANVRRTAAGYMLVFRYRVLDEQKAKPVFERRYKPRLVHEESGAEFIVPAPRKTGPLRNSNLPQANRIYWMAFANPGGYIQKGDHVSIIIGDFRAEHLVVQ